MGMTSNEGDNDEGLAEDKSFSPLYPVLNFGNTTTTFATDFLECASPPSYDLMQQQHGFSEKKVF